MTTAAIGTDKMNRLAGARRSSLQEPSQAMMMNQRPRSKSPVRSRYAPENETVLSLQDEMDRAFTSAPRASRGRSVAASFTGGVATTSPPRSASPPMTANRNVRNAGTGLAASLGSTSMASSAAAALAASTMTPSSPRKTRGGVSSSMVAPASAPMAAYPRSRRQSCGPMLAAPSAPPAQQQMRSPRRASAIHPNAALATGTEVNRRQSWAVGGPLGAGNNKRGMIALTDLFDKDELGLSDTDEEEAPAVSLLKQPEPPAPPADPSPSPRLSPKAMISRRNLMMSIHQSGNLQIPSVDHDSSKPQNKNKNNDQLTKMLDDYQKWKNEDPFEIIKKERMKLELLSASKKEHRRIGMKTPITADGAGGSGKNSSDEETKKANAGPRVDGLFKEASSECLMFPGDMGGKRQGKSPKRTNGKPKRGGKTNKKEAAPGAKTKSVDAGRKKKVGGVSHIMPSLRQARS